MLEKQKVAKSVANSSVIDSTKETHFTTKYNVRYYSFISAK